MTTTAQSILDGLQKAMLLRVGRANHRPRRDLVLGADGEPVFRVVRDKLGDVMRVYRADTASRSTYSGADLRAIRAQKGVGRPPMLLGWAKVPEDCTPQLATVRDVVRKHGSQRKAAAAMGWSLGKLQRRLAKEAVA